MFSLLDSQGQSRLVHLTSDWAFQLVNDSLAFSRADSFCRGQFSFLATLDQSEDREGALELLRQTGLRPPMWVSDPSKAASQPVALSKQCECYQQNHKLIKQVKNYKTKTNNNNIIW